MLATSGTRFVVRGQPFIAADRLRRRLNSGRYFAGLHGKGDMQ